MRNEELGSEGIPFVRGGNIRDGWIDVDTTDFIRAEFADRVASKLTRPGDVAFITKGTVGRTAFLRADQPAVVFAPQVAYWRVLDHSRLDPRFVFYLLRGAEFQTSLDAVKSHGAMVADYVSISQQHEFHLSFPPVMEQRAIARILGALDDKIEVNRRTIETLETMSRSIFKSRFVDFDTAGARSIQLRKDLVSNRSDLPSGWTWESVPDGYRIAPLGELFELDAVSVSPVDYPPETLWEHYSLPEFDRSSLPALEPGISIKSHKFRVPQDVVLISKLNPVTPRVWLPAVQRPEFAICSTEFLPLRPRREYLPYCYELLRSEYVTSEARARVSGTTGSHQRVSPSALLSISVGIPDHPSVLAFGELVSPLHRQKAQRLHECRTLSVLRDALLPRLLSGELRVKDAERLAGAAL